MGVGVAFCERDDFKDKISIFENMFYGFTYICLPIAFVAVDNRVELTGVI